MAAVSAPPPRRSRRRRILLFAVVAVVLLLVIHAGLDVWAGYKLRAQIAHLETRYGSMNEDTLRRPPVPDADNRARIVRAAAALIVPGPDPGRIYRFVSREPSFPVPADVRAFADSNQAATRLAAEIRNRSQSNWEIEPRDAGNQPNFLEIRTLSSAIYTNVLLEVEAGRPDEAAKVVTTGLAIAASLGQEWGLLAQLVRIAIGLQHFEAIEEVIANAEPSKGALEEVARWLRDSREPNPLRYGLVGEMKAANGTLEALETGAQRNLDSLTSNMASWKGTPSRLIGRPFIRLARLRYLQEVERLLDAHAAPPRRPSSTVPSKPPFWNVSARMADAFITGIERSAQTSDLYLSALSATEIGVALRRYRLDRGSYPQDLSALSPTYLTAVPMDPFSGKPPVYARVGAGFTLHSEGGSDQAPIKSTLDWKVEK